MTDEIEIEAAAGQADESPQEDLIVDILTGDERRSTPREEIIQRMIAVLAGEYRYPLESMSRDVSVRVSLDGRTRTKTADIVVFTPGLPHELSNARRAVVVQPPNVKSGDATRGVPLLKDVLDGLDDCEFGLWTNGRDVAYLQKIPAPVQNRYAELSDFPGNGESLDDLDRPDRRVARVAVAEDLRETVLRCHDYLYGNQSMTAPRAFAEMIKLIFCKIYDERRLREDTRYRRQFWVGVTERNSEEGQQAIANRLRQLFADVKTATDLSDVFREADEIDLEARHLAWIAGELSRYNFLDAEVDVKGMAYEAMVATTMKRERGQFFTPRNVVEAMVDILAPEPGERVLDPACGSGRFLVACLDRFRQARAEGMGAAEATELRRRRNSREVLAQASGYAQHCLFGVDVDPELQRAAKMNMLINNDGHGNLFVANSLEITPTMLATGAVIGSEHLAFDGFDVVLTNPPFGAKIPIDDPAVLRNFDLAHRWQKTDHGTWVKLEGKLKPKMPPEILFIERCMQWLKEGGRMGIVVPDGILGNPDTEYIRYWILQQARVLASIDLPVEAFLPQVGVQASLLFLRKKTRQEVNAGVQDNHQVFMAVAESVGHDRRGNRLFRRDPDGYDITETYEIDLTVLRDGQPTSERRTLRRKRLADDMPLISAAYRFWRETGTIQEMSE